MSTPEAPRQQGAPAAKRSWTDLGPRLASAAVLIPLTVAALYLGGYAFAALVGAVFAGCYREWERMVTLQPLGTLGIVLVALVAIAAVGYPLIGIAGSLGLILLGCIAVFVADRRTALWRAGGLAVFGLVAVAAVAMRGDTLAGAQVGVFLGATVWLTDTGAFFAGRQIGGEKLAPDISPSKTWSGAFGGLALGTLAGLVVWLIIAPQAPFWIGLGFAAVISVLGQLGDLGESAIKRRFRVKDSGDIIPGHGGLMDRLDSLTFGVLLVFAVGWMRGGIDGIATGFLTW